MDESWFVGSYSLRDRYFGLSGCEVSLFMGIAGRCG